METAPQPNSVFNINNIKEVLIFRFMLFCDQCHDFCESGRDNAWIDQIKGAPAPPNNKDQIFQCLRDSYVEDITWFFQEWNSNYSSLPEAQAQQADFPTADFYKMIYIVDEGNYTFKFLEEGDLGKLRPPFSNTDQMVTSIDDIFKNILSISHISSSDIIGTKQQKSPCSGSAIIAEAVMDVEAAHSKLDYTNRYITVDADKSKMNLSSLLLLLCDNVNDGKGVFGIKTAATQYDAASASGTFSYLEKIKNAYVKRRQNVNIKFIDLIQTIKFEIFYYDIRIYSFKYVVEEVTQSHEFELLNILKLFPKFYNDITKIHEYMVKYGGEEVDLKIGICKSIQDKIKSICGIKTNVTVSKWIKDEMKEATPSGIAEATLKKYLLALYVHLEKKKKAGGITEEYINYISNQFLELEQINKKYTVTMKINKFFSKNFDQAPVLNEGINDKGSSVSAITQKKTDVAFDSNGWIKYITCFKTNSDLGQMLYLLVIAFTENTKRVPMNPYYFITFDQICARISAFFQHVVYMRTVAASSPVSTPLNSIGYRTLFENLSSETVITPITFFVNNNELRGVRAGVESLLILQQPMEGVEPAPAEDVEMGFGRRGKRKLLKSNKKYSEKVIKLAKIYNIKLDNNTVSKIKNLQSLQKKAKKMNINITKKNSKGKRIYKSNKELMKNIKDFIKFKKTNSKKTTSKKTNSKKTNSKKTNSKKTNSKIELLRKKAKKMNIRITKTLSNGKRRYKTIKELEKNLKIR